MIRTMIARLSVIACFVACAGVAERAHAQGSCPAVGTVTGTSIEGYAFDATTLEKYSDGAVVTIGTVLKMTGDAVAGGWCDVRYATAQGCALAWREYRGVSTIQTSHVITDATGVHSYGPRNHYPNTGGLGTAPRQFFNGINNPTGAPYSEFGHGTVPGTWKFSTRNATYGTAFCALTPTEVWDNYTIDFVDKIRPCTAADKPKGREKNANVGNPCDAATGNKTQVESDYSGLTTGISLSRTYNSSIPINFGFGYGWASPLHKRIEITSTTRRLRRGSGAEEGFQASGGGWVSPPDSQFQLVEDGTGYTVTLRDGATERYNLAGALQSETDRVGNVTIYAYDSSDRLVSVTGPYGHALSFSYNSGGEIASVTVPSGDTIDYAYDADERLTRVTYEDGSYRDYLYEMSSFPYALTGIIDENGDRYATFGYASGKAILTQHAQTTNGVPQEKFSIVYDSATKSTVTDPAGNVWVYSFQKQHDVKKLTSRVSQSDGRTLSQTFDSSNNLLTQTDETGRVTTFTYNTSNQRISMTEASGTPQARTTTYEYLSPTEDLITNISSSSVAGGSLTKETTIAYDASRNITEVTIEGYDLVGTPVSRTTAMEYNTSGQVTEIDGPRTDVSDITTLEYYECTGGDECGQLESITNALGHSTTFDAYDERGRVTQTTDPNGVLTTYDYDLRGRVLTITETPPGGSARLTTHTYDDAGQVQTITAPNGLLLTHAYDPAHDLRSITDNLGNAIEYTYDTRGNRKDENVKDPSSALRRTTTYVYDLRSRIESINAAGSVTDTVFDAVGNLTDEADPNNNDTEHDYDPLNRLVQTVDALSGVTEYGYDKNDYLTVVDAPNGATTTYDYDDLGNLLAVDSPDTGATTYAYDAAGNRVSQTDANGVTVAYAYDALNRLTSIDYPGASLDVTLAYDQGVGQLGRLTAMSDGSGSASFEHDPFGNLVEESKTIGSNTHMTAYEYDAADLVMSITYPSGRTLDYTRNVLGQITAVASAYGGSSTTLASNASYEPFGPLKGLTFGNGLVLSRAFDQQYRLTDQTTGTVQDLGFTLDAAGNIDAIADGVNAGLSQGFDQDALHRVMTDAGSYGTKGYTYDGVGNRLTRTHGATTQTLTYTASSNRLATHDGQSVSLDAAGNTLANPGENVSFIYGAHNRMLEAYVGGVLKATYVFDGHGQRVKKTEATGAQRTFVYHYGLGGELLGEAVYSASGGKIGERDYLWLDALPLAQSERTFSGGSITSSQLIYLHADQLNTPRLATNASGTVVWRWDSDAFGTDAANEDPDSDTNLVSVRLRFPGQYLDEETGLHYNYFRDYDPVTGRYVQSDPIGIAAGINTYAYVGGNPLARHDPLGLAERWYAPGSISNESSSPIPVSRDGGPPGIVPPGTPENPSKSPGSRWIPTPSTPDWDFAWIDCTCWKIGPGELDIGPDGKPKPYQIMHGPAPEEFCRSIPKPASCDEDC